MNFADIALQNPIYRDKVLGCWVGKNCGGTLGAPLETPWGQPDPFDIWWYPQLQTGGIPNDDLEMQLIWLKALEDIGPRLCAIDLVHYWLDHIGYNWDEYGMSKTNLRLGLLPPISGAYNNWFKDCMGSPIRSEIWACIAPGAPDIAVRYAFEDAICDHAGGEGVFGELFNAAVESAAFLISDRDTLIDIGLSYIPPWCVTARAIKVARAAYAAGEHWHVARNHVLAATPHAIAQYTPINIAFEVIGWLYGEDFGDALCKAVNCGYDTDCTGATLGSILGIIAGYSALPERWIAPLGKTIATNASWGGLRNLAHLPETLDELTDRVCAMMPQVLLAHGRSYDEKPMREDAAQFLAASDVKTLWAANPMRMTISLGSTAVTIDYGDTPAVTPDSVKVLTTELVNPHADPITLRCEMRLPLGWQDTEGQRIVSIPPYATISLAWPIAIPSASLLENSNTLLLSVQPIQRPAQFAVPIVLVGASQYRVSGPYHVMNADDGALWDHPFLPEQLSNMGPKSGMRTGEWQVAFSLDNTVPVPAEPGVYYAQTYLWSTDDLDIWLGAVANSPTKLWCNHIFVHDRFTWSPIRPYYGGTSEDGFAQVHLHQGWNEILMKFLRPSTMAPFSAYLIYSSADILHEGLPALGRTRTPWDAEG